MGLSTRNSILCCAFALANVANAHASQVLPGQSWAATTPLFEKEQVTYFLVENVPGSVNAVVRGAVLELSAKGDYSTAIPSESLSWSIEGIASGVGRPGTGVLIRASDSDDVEWKQQFSVNRKELEQIVADGVLEITLTNSPEVNIGFDPSDYNAWRFVATATPVPVPGALLFGLFALVGILTTRRRTPV